MVITTSNIWIHTIGSKFRDLLTLNTLDKYNFIQSFCYEGYIIDYRILIIIINEKLDKY